MSFLDNFHANCNHAYGRDGENPKSQNWFLLHPQILGSGAFIKPWPIMSFCILFDLLWPYSIFSANQSNLERDRKREWRERKRVVHLFFIFYEIPHTVAIMIIPLLQLCFYFPQNPYSFLLSSFFFLFQALPRHTCVCIRHRHRLKWEKKNRVQQIQWIWIIIIPSWPHNIYASYIIYPDGPKAWLIFWYLLYDYIYSSIQLRWLSGQLLVLKHIDITALLHVTLDLGKNLV